MHSSTASPYYPQNAAFEVDNKVDIIVTTTIQLKHQIPVPGHPLTSHYSLLPNAVTQILPSY
jgi:hypothetical protein